MSDVLATSADESKHPLLKKFDLLKMLKEIINGNMMDTQLESNLRERQLEIDELWSFLLCSAFAQESSAMS